MIDLIFPVTIANHDEASATLMSLFAHSEFDIRVILVMDGGKRQSYSGAESMVREKSKKWSAIHFPQPMGYNHCFTEALIQHGSASGRIMTMDPGVIIKDRSWFMKMTIPFGRDRSAAMVVTGGVATKSKTLPPIKLSGSVDAPHRVSIIRSSKKNDSYVLQVDGEDIVFTISKRLIAEGCNVWMSGGVDYDYVDCKRQKP